MEIHGKVDSKFSLLAEEFEKNFKERGEIGASVCMTIEGETVVDLWAGKKNPETEEPWEKDTKSIVWSSTKGATALCAHILSSRGKLELKRPVAEYWPEFAQNGKENITVNMLLNHQAALPAIRSETGQTDFADWDQMVHYLEKEAPFWEPGTQTGYHAITYGWLVGEVVRRVSGKSLGQFFHEEVAKPLNLDFWIGLPEDRIDEVSKMIMPDQDGSTTEFYEKAVTDQSSIPFLISANNGGYMQNFDSVEAYRAEIGAAGGITNARGLAGMYAPLANGGTLGDVQLVDEHTLQRMAYVSSATERDSSLLIPTRFSLGFAKSVNNDHIQYSDAVSMIMSEDAFGHPGNGGSFGFASPENRMSLAYTMNKMGAGILVNERGQSLIDAAYKSLGYRSKASGSWER